MRDKIPRSGAELHIWRPQSRSDSFGTRFHMADTGSGRKNNQSGEAAVAAAPNVKTDKSSHMTVKYEGDDAKRTQNAESVGVDSADSFARGAHRVMTSGSGSASDRHRSRAPERSRSPMGVADDGYYCKYEWWEDDGKETWGEYERRQRRTKET